MLALCYQPCNPLSPACTIAGDICAAFVDEFVCQPDAWNSSEMLYKKCTVGNECGPGNFCGSAAATAQCSSSDPRCCLQVCDLGAPACPMGMTCAAYFAEAAPSGLEAIGYCRDGG